MPRNTVFKCITVRNQKGPRTQNLRFFQLALLVPAPDAGEPRRGGPSGTPAAAAAARWTEGPVAPAGPGPVHMVRWAPEAGDS